MKTEVLTIGIQKGGTGKTTTAAALAQAAVEDGKKVLCIDLDPQGNFSFAIGADRSGGNSYDLLTGTPAADVIQTTPQRLEAIPASADLATIQGGRGTARKLQEALKPIKKRFDVIIIDTPTAGGTLLYNALQASTMLLIPLEADNNSLQGLYQTLDTAHAIQQSNPALSFIGTAITKYDGRPNINKYLREVIEQTAAEAGAPCLATIRLGISIKEAQNFQQSVYDFAPRSRPAAEYMGLYKKLFS